jgi:SPP1 gp7 family putative phage head morphogenesis protein
MNKSQKELIKLQKKKENKAKYLLLGLLLVLSKDELIANIKPLAKNFFNFIKDVRQDAFDIADKNSIEEQKLKTAYRNIIITVASINVITKVVATIDNIMSTAKEEGKAAITYEDAVKEAIDQVKPNIKRIIITETQEAYNKKIVVNHKDLKGYYRWNSQLDKRCCSTCVHNDGKTAVDEWDLIHKCGHFPSHPNCRCFIEFITTNK